MGKRNPERILFEKGQMIAWDPGYGSITERGGIPGRQVFVRREPHPTIENRQVPIYEWQPYDYIENEPFEDTLKFVGFRAGRSSRKVVFHCQRLDKEVEMFMSDFENILGSLDWTLDGRWLARKQGANFGIYKLGESNDK